MLWRLCALVAWAAALVALIEADPDSGIFYLTLAAPLTLAVGALVDRFWALGAPVVVAVAITVVGTMADVRSDTTVREFLLLYGIVFTVPAIVLLAAGIGLRRLIRRRDSGAGAARPPALRRSRPPGPVAP